MAYNSADVFVVRKPYCAPWATKMGKRGRMERKKQINRNRGDPLDNHIRVHTHANHTKHGSLQVRRL